MILYITYMVDLSATTKIETLIITVCWTEFHIIISGFGIHGRSHSERVILFANMLASMIQSDKDIVLDMQAIFGETD